jgi:hypothetical protein
MTRDRHDHALDQLLTGEGAHWRAEQPAAPSLAALADAARRSSSRIRRRRWLPPALAAAVIGVVAVSMTALGQHHDRPSATPGPPLVPWSSLPAGPTPQAPTKIARLGGPPVGTPACRSEDLTGAAVRSPGADQLFTLVVQSHRTTPCYVKPAPPAIDLIDGQGRTVVHGGGNPSAIGYVGVRVVKPNQVITLSTGVCAEADIATLIVTFRPPESKGAAAAVSIPLSGRPITPCPARPGTHIEAGASSDALTLADAGSVTSLVVSIDAPAQVRSGTTLRYTLTLTNATNTAVPLTPCPSYEQGLIDPLNNLHNQPGVATGMLNCAAAPPAIAPHTSIAITMNLDTTGIPTGTRTLVWSWLGHEDFGGFAGYPKIDAVSE